MIGSPLEADPLPGTSRFYTSQRDAHMPPPYASQQPPPPYPSCTPTPKATIPQPSTRSVPFGHGVTFEWNSALPSSPDDIIIVTVRTNQLGLSRRQSFDDPLPERPQPRSFLRRLSSRMLHTNSEYQNLRAVRMPRREYLRHHKRDEEGNYAGSEPQLDWDDNMLESCYGRYQRTPLVPNGLYQNAAMRM